MTTTFQMLILIKAEMQQLMEKTARPMKFKLTKKNKQENQKLHRAGKNHLINYRMKKTFYVLTILALFSFGLSAQTKKDGTPDMRYKENKQSYSTPSYPASKTSTPRNYSNGIQSKVQKGYQKSSGTDVAHTLKPLQTKKME